MALNPLDRLVRDMEDVKRQLAGRSQLNHSSLENTAIPVYDEDGAERLRIGAQDDGTHAIKYVQGPPPPRPTAPIVSVDGPVVRVRWDGILMGGHIPEDFARVDVHFALASEDIESPEAVRANLATSAGNETVLAATATGTYRVGLVAVSQSRARSEMSDTVEVDVTLVDLEGALDAVVENARGGSNYYQPTPPPGTEHDPDRDLWFDTSVGEDGLVSYSPHRWDGAEWVSIADQRTAALKEALGDLEGMVDQRLTEAGDRLDGLEESLGELDSTTLPGLRQDLDAAKGRLDTAEGQITDAFGQLDGIPGQISDAQQAAIDAAAQDAAQKAQAAQQAAQEHADLVAQGAESDAIAAAEVRAQQLADAAQQAAEEAAQAKADAAQAAAIADAEGKINIARQAVEAQAQAAQQAADAAMAQADAILSRGDNLLLNGGFERGWDGWAVWGGEIVETPDAYSGVFVARLGDPVANQYPRSSAVETTQGRTYFMEAWFRRLPGGTDTSNVQFYTQTILRDGSMVGEYAVDLDGYLMRVDGSVLPEGEWFRLEGYLTTAPDAVGVRFAPHVTRQGTQYDVDDMRVVDVTDSLQALTAAREAQDAADDAHQAAGEAADAADAAMDRANAVKGEAEDYADGLPKVLHGTTVPAGTAPDGSIWWQHQGALSGPVVGQWNRANGAWRSTPIASEAIANLDVGKLSAGAAEIAEVVSQKIAGAVGRFLELDVGQLTVTGDSKLADVVAEAIAADVGRFIEVEVGRLVAGEGVLDEAVIQKLFAEVVVAQMAFAESFIGTNALLEGSITAESGIIGSIDLGVAIVGKLHGMYIEGQTIDTPQLAFGAATGDILAVDALNFKTAVGLDIRGSSFRAGDAVEITEDFGIRQFGPDGALNVSLPSDGSEAQFRGDLSARTLTATGRMAIQGPGAVASGGVLELESGVVPPVGPPTASSHVERTAFPPLSETDSARGVAFADGHWWRAVDSTISGGSDRIEKISTDGTLVSSFEHFFWVSNGMTAIGNELYCLGIEEPGRDQKRRWVYVYGTDGAFKRKWEYPNFGTGDYQPGIGTNGTDVVIAQTWSTTSRARTLTWRRFNRTTGALLGETHTSYRLSADIVGISVTAADYGTQRVIVTTGRETGAVEVYTPSGGHVESGGWYAGDKQRVRSTVWHDGRFHHLTEGGDLVTMSATVYPNGSPGPDTNDWWAAVTWADGSHETTVGPSRRFTFPRRSDLRISFGTPPEGVTHARVYLARKATDPSPGDFHLAGEVPAVAEQVTISLPVEWASAPNPPAENTFDDSTPGIIRSTLGQFEVDGTGAGRWGPLTFHADGTMSSSAVPDWIPVTTFQAGFGPQTWGFVPAYRIWPDGKVEWRGVIAGSVTTTVAALTVPVAARPPHPVNLLAATNNTGGADATARIEFGPMTAPDTLRIYRGSTDRTWVSLDGTSYYLQ